MTEANEGQFSPFFVCGFFEHFKILFDKEP